jgi:hypothetical protein
VTTDGQELRFCMHDREDLHIPFRPQNAFSVAPAIHNARAIHENMRDTQVPVQGHWLSPHAAAAAAWLTDRWPFDGTRPTFEAVAETVGEALFGSTVRVLTWTAVTLFAALTVLLVHTSR